MIYNDILRLDVSMDDPIAVEVGNSFVDIVKDHQNLVLGKLFALFDHFKEMIARAVLHHEVYVVFVVEEAVELDHVGVTEIELNFYLANERGLEILLSYYFL